VAVRFLEAPTRIRSLICSTPSGRDSSRFFRTRGCDLALAEDLAQEVMLSVYRKAAQVRDRASFRAWLFRIARNAPAGTMASRLGKWKL